MTVLHSKTRDWFTLSSWQPIWEELKLSPDDVPGVRKLPGSKSDREPYPYEIHRTHLPIIGSFIRRDTIPIGYTRVESPHPILRSYQVDTANFIRARRGTLLASEQRTGKTPSIMYAFEPEYGPMLVVGPVAARSVWKEWAERRFGEGSFAALDGQKPHAIESTKVLFMTFAVVPHWRSMISDSSLKSFDKLGMLVVDEAHLAGTQNRKSLTYESLRWFNSIAHQCVCATGTPLFNKPAGLYPLLDLCAPAAFGGFWDFAKRYCDAQPGPYGWRAVGISNEDELNRRLVQIVYRKKWTDIQQDLPPITRTVETVAISSITRNEIDTVASKMRSSLTQVKTAVGLLAHLRRLFAEAKIDSAVEAAKKEIREGKSVIVWAWHTDIAERIARILRESGHSVSLPITGKVRGRIREEIVSDAACQAACNPHVLVANMATLGTAVNLAWAQRAIFAELDWSPPTVQQAEMRIYNGVNPCSVTYLVADCESDEELCKALQSKLVNQDKLNLRAGVGDVSEVLGKTFGVKQEASLAALATALMANSLGEV